MPVLLSDKEIQDLVKEIKHFPRNYKKLWKRKSKKGHKESELIIERDDGSFFRIIIRQNLYNPLDFSAVLGFISPNSNLFFRLKRYNGKSHEYSNKIEKIRFYNFHIHTATERYQQMGFDEDGYAEETDQYVGLQSAIGYLIQDCNIVLPEDKDTYELF